MKQLSLIALIPALAILCAFFCLVFGIAPMPANEAEMSKIATVFFSSIFTSFVLCIISTIKGE